MNKKRFFRVMLAVSVLGLLLGGMTAKAQNQQHTSIDKPNSSVITPELIGQVGGANYAIAWQGNYAYLGVGPRLVILDVSSPSMPVFVGQTGLLPDIVDDIVIEGSYAYVANNYTGGLRIIDVSNPMAPTEVGFFEIPSWAEGVAVAGSYAYVASADIGLRIIDISNPAAPVEVGFYDTPGWAYGVTIAGNYAYITDENEGLRIIDISNPANPIELGFYNTPGYALGITVSGSYAYVADGTSGLRIIDISNPTVPMEVGFYNTPYFANDVVVAANNAFIADMDSGLRIIDISNPAVPIEVGFYDTPGSSSAVVLAGSNAYVADGWRGLSVIDVSNPVDPTKVGDYETPGLADGVAIAGNYAYNAGYYSGLNIIDISNRTDPTGVGFYDTSGTSNGVAVDGNYAYVADGISGLSIVDVSNPSAPIQVGFYDTPGYAYNVVVAGNYAYIADDSSGLRIIDVSNPSAPVETGFYDTPGYASDVVVVGDYAYIADSNSGLRIIDISNPATPVEIGSSDTPSHAVSVPVEGNYAYVANSGSGLYIIDVSNPSAPTEIGFCSIPSIADDVAVMGNYAILANGINGMHFIDISNPANPIEVGFFDTPGYAVGVTVAGSYIYVGTYIGGLVILRIGPNTPPVAMDDSGVGFITDEDTPFLTGDVLANDFDPDGDPLFVESFDDSGTIGLVSLPVDGGLDPSFDSDGKVTTNFSKGDDVGHALILQPDGKLVVAGSSQGDFIVARYNPDGSLDASFGEDGYVTTDFGSRGDNGAAIALQPDGKIVVAGTTADYPNVDFAIARYNADGSLDSGFDGDGKVTTDFGGDDRGFSVAIQPDNKIVVSGNAYINNTSYFAVARYNPYGSLDTSFDGDGKVTQIGSYESGSSIAIQTDGKIIVTGSMSSDFAVLRYNPDGSLDSSFDGDGIVTTDFGEFDTTTAIALQTDGKIVVTGCATFDDNDDFALARYNPDGSLDTSFDGDGKVTTDFGGDDLGYTNELQLDGKIVVAGETDFYPNTNYAAARYNPDGSLDSSFDGDGKVTTDFGGSEDRGYSIIIQQDAKLVMAGYTLNINNNDFAMARYNPDGSLDPSFDIDGMVITNFSNNGEDIGWPVTIQPDGKIIVAGTTGSYHNPDLAVARYNPDGSLDFDFDGDGKVTTDFGSDEMSFDVALQPDGKIIVAGRSGEDFAVARYNPDGSLDSTFDGDGLVTTDFGDLDSAFAIALQPDGKLIVVGYACFAPDYDFEFAVIRYNPDGSLDASFDGDGKVTTDFGVGTYDIGFAVAIQPDGKIVVAGGSVDNFALARYNPDGSLDTSFSNDGILTTNFGGDDRGQAMALQGDGRIVVGGYSAGDFALARYNPDGSLDTSFDGDGKVTTDFAGFIDFGFDIALQPDEKVILAGTTDNGINDDFALVRYNPDGSLDSTFGGDGKVTTDFYGFDDWGYGIALQLDGKIVAAGAADDGNNADFAVVRYSRGGGAFNFDPNSQFEWLGAGEQAFDTFTYVVSDGILTDTATVSITVNGVNDAPVAEAGDNQEADEGQAITFAGSFTDPDWQGGTIEWDFGDGFTATGTLTPTHTYFDNGVYTVTLTVTDDEGAAGSDWLLATINNVAPWMDVLPDMSVKAGIAVTLTATFSDPGLLDTHQVVIEWSPGYTQTLDLAAGVNDFNAVYTYAEAGEYLVTVTVSDEDGGVISQTFTVTVLPASVHIYIPIISRQ